MEDYRLYKRLDKVEELLYSLSSLTQQQEQLIKLLQEKIKRLESVVYEDGSSK